MITPTPQTIDKYQIITPLGSGNFGQVFHVFDRALGAEKAIKVLLSSDPAEFMQNLEEAQILNKCQHKHIVAINEANIFTVNGTNRVVLDLEYIPEGSLEAALSSRWVSIRESVEYIRGALHGVEHAHAQGFLHRDVKPGNILLSPKTPKLSDFGLATDTGTSLIGSAQGYRPHLPPEYYSKGVTSEQTDIFAMGVTFFRALLNIADWRAVIKAVPNLPDHMQKGTLVRRIGFEEFIPDSLRRIVRKACHPDPAKRFPTARAFGQRLDAVRFNIDWIRVGDNEWQGHCGAGKLYRCVTDLAKNAVTVSVNGRNVRSECKKHKSITEAIGHMNQYVAKTTLT
jgi:eukaryotic-like serine/threonine-protein kinase